MAKLKHWRALQGKIAPETAPVLEFGRAAIAPDFVNDGGSRSMPAKIQRRAKAVLTTRTQQPRPG